MTTITDVLASQMKLLNREHLVVESDMCVDFEDE